MAMQLRPWPTGAGHRRQLSTRTEGLRDRIDRNDERQERLEDRVARVEERLRAPVHALDTR